MVARNWVECRYRSFFLFKADGIGGKEVGGYARVGEGRKGGGKGRGKIVLVMWLVYYCEV